MNLMEIGKSPETKQEEIPERPMNSESIPESWNQPLQKQEESPVKIKVERDILRQNSEKARELMRIQKQQIQALEAEKQTLLSDRQRLRGEVQKSIEEMQCLKTELSETQRLNQSLQQSNDDLRNRNGMMSRREQEQLENEIKDVRDRNSKLQIQVNQSSVEAVKQAKKEKEEAEKHARFVEHQAENAKKQADTQIRKVKLDVEKQMEVLKEKEHLWGTGYVTIILFAILNNRTFQRDLFDFFVVPFRWYYRFIEWLMIPTYDDGFGNQIAYQTGEAWFFRILSLIVVITILVIFVLYIVEGIQVYKKQWDNISKLCLLESISGIAVLGDIIREYLPVNLVILFCGINIGIMLLRMYLQNRFEDV